LDHQGFSRNHAGLYRSKGALHVRHPFFTIPLIHEQRRHAWFLGAGERAGPESAAGNQSGDHVLQAGMQLAVQAGQRLVFEPFERTSQQAVLFEWAPDTDLVSSPTVQSAATVTQALQDLRLALGLVGDALMRLCTGLASYGRQLVWGRGAVHAPHCG
jgi:hypothetical protein